MTAPPEPGPAGHGPGGPPHAVRNEGIRTLLQLASQGDPDARLSMSQVLGSLQQGAFGMFLLLAILPAFLPLPGVAGALSGPLVMLIGAQMSIGLATPWLPRALGRRGPRRRTLYRFTHRLDRPLRKLDRLLRPSFALAVAPLPARMFTGLQLLLLGLLLSLPIPFTNYLFGCQLLLFALALLERDGRLMAINWAGGIAAIAFFGLGTGELVTYLVQLLDGWRR